MEELREFYIEFAINYCRERQQKSERCRIDESTMAIATSQDKTNELIVLFKEDSNDSSLGQNLLIEFVLHEIDVKNAWVEFKRFVQEWSKYIYPLQGSSEIFP